MINDLYSSSLLTLAANMPRLGRLAEPDGSADKAAKLCGSTIHVELTLRDGHITDYAQEVKACALGQAAASILGAHVLDATPAEIELARDAFRAMLKTGGAPPTGRFSDLAMLAPVKDYPARHASTLLAFDATVEACRVAALHENATRTTAADAA